MDTSTETRIYIGDMVTQTLTGFKGLRLRRHYTGVLQQDGQVLVATVGAPTGSGVLLTAEQWQKWFEK